MNHPTARQLWGQSTATNLGIAAQCTSFELPSGGVLVFNDSFTTTLTHLITFTQPCKVNGTDPGSTGNSTVVQAVPDPFYASTSPQIFAIASATVISYLLVILIFITPRSYFFSGPGGAAGVLNRRGRISGSNSSSSVVGSGTRPWLQKIATCTVAISLTIATADTFRVAEWQYNQGYTDASQLVDKVVGSREIQVIRVISDTFLWLAQVQTLIRLFPRHKEKVTIKWLGFALVTFDTVFSTLNNFVDPGNKDKTRPRSFQDAIPALSYLFELAIGLIYASCVIYYSLSKRRIAFWHSKMKNICLVALISLISVLIPVVFFVLDVSKPNVAGWGDYIRWVGAAAASVVVWEWVERIEELERDERKDGILGREIFDGDEMLDPTFREDSGWPTRRPSWERQGAQSGDRELDNTGGKRHWPLHASIPFRKGPGKPTETAGHVHNPSRAVIDSVAANGLSLTPNTATPVSRSDTTSAASTVYAVHYYTAGSPAARIPEDLQTVPADAVDPKESSDQSTSETSALEGTESAKDLSDPVAQVKETAEAPQQSLRPTQIWRAVPNPFKRRRASPPAEVAGAQLGEGLARVSPIDSRPNLRNRMTAFTTSQRVKFSTRDLSRQTDIPLAVTVIPAQRRDHRVSSPEETADPVTPTGLVARNELTEAEHGVETGNEEVRSQASGSEIGVVVIPAPRRGQRTWSPQDPIPPSPAESPQPPAESGLSGPISRHSPGSLVSSASPHSYGSLAPNGMVYSTRGSLVISEDQHRGQFLPRRHSGTSRRSPYARVSPLTVESGPPPAPAPVQAPSASATAADVEASPHVPPDR